MSIDNAMTIDAHFHCWQLARGDYAWLTPAQGVIYRDVTVADWQAQSTTHGVTGGLLVQAAPTEAETLYLLEQAALHEHVLGVVGWVDLLHTDAPERIRHLARHPKLKGLRPMLQDIEDPRWILQSGLAPALRTMVDCGLVFDALVKPVHLPHILTLAQRHPDLSLVVDHAAKPAIVTGEWQPWADNLAALASDTRALCKLSGLMTEAAPACAPDAVRPWGDFVLKVFGPHRVAWGSDWPVLERNGSYRQWWRETQVMLSHLSPTEQASVLGENARRLYRL
jgi:L-fuconolactonase